MRSFFVCLSLVLLVVSSITSAFAADDETTAELARRIDVLTQEVEQLRLGTAADTTTRLTSRMGLGPAASKVYGISRGVSIGGYGEMLYENFDRENENGGPSGMIDRLDFLRAVFYVGYKFDESLLFNSEIEIEHAGVQDEAAVAGEADPLTGEVTGTAELSGEVVLEFAYLEWLQRREFGVRAGMLLVPVGIVNELHEPTVFIGAHRPEVEQRIIPTTWRANGIGAFGDVGTGLAYRLYVTEGLNAAHFSAAGIRDGRQSGSGSLFTRPAVTARVDYSGTSGLVVGGSVFTGDCWQEFQPTASDLTPRLTLFDIHARGQWRGLQANALYAYSTLSDAGDLSDALNLAGTARIGDSSYGAYAEAAYDLVPLWWPSSRYELSPYFRWETYDTQEDVSGGAENPALEHTIVTAGAAFRPHPQVVMKLDRAWRSNAAETATSQWNVALGYMF